MIVRAFRLVVRVMIAQVADRVIHQIVVKAANFVENALKTNTCEKGQDAVRVIPITTRESLTYELAGLY